MHGDEELFSSFMINLSSSAPPAAVPPAAAPPTNFANDGLDAGEALSLLTLDVVAAPTLSRLQDVALRGALALSGARQGVLTLRGDSFEAPGAATSRESQTITIGEDGIARAGSEKALVTTGAGWMQWPLVWDGNDLGQLSLRFDAGNSAAKRALEMLCAHIAATAAKTRLFEQLQNIKYEWQAMLDGMIDGVYVCDQNGTILRANRALATMLDIPITQVLGNKRDELWTQLPDYLVTRPWQSLEVGPTHLSPQMTEFRCGAPDRVYVEMAFELHARNDAFDNSATETARAEIAKAEIARAETARANDERAQPEERRLCVLHDVTESRRLQEQLLQSEKLAALGELTSGVAHELNNPLATVVGYAELLALDTQLPEGVKRKLATIHQEATRASHIVSNLLSYARRSSPEKSFVDLNDVVGAALEMRRYQLQTDNVRISTDFSDNAPAIWGDELQLQQVVLNIVNNAAQAVSSWRGSGEIRIWTRAATLSGHAAARLIIEDNGPGIAPEHLRRVFDPFFTTKPTGEGTGLGMSISLRIISNHEGLIWAESRLGHGARFIIELPGAAGSEVVAEAEDAPAHGEKEDESAHILVIDDEEPVVTLMTEILQLDGHRVTPAFNGAEAIALLSADEYDLILSDVRMPAVGGPTFFEILQTTRPDLLPKVMFVTGDTMSASTQEFLQRAARPVLSKPFDPERLRTMVADNLRETRAQ